VTSVPSATPSSRNCTPTTPVLSLAVADTVTIPETVAPFAGAVIDIVGAWCPAASNQQSSERPRPPDRPRSAQSSSYRTQSSDCPS